MKSKNLTKRLLAAFLALFIFGQVFAVSASAAEPRVTITPSANGSFLWKNGSTKEYVYSTIRDCQNGTNSIGYINPYEEALVRGYYAGYFIVMYAVDGTGHRKVGFVKYNGGNTNPYWDPKPFISPTKTHVYKSSGDAWINMNPIGFVNANESCTILLGGNECAILLYTADGTPKVGFANV